MMKGAAGNGKQRYGDFFWGISLKQSRIEPLNCSSLREEAPSEIPEAKLEPSHVGCYEICGETPLSDASLHGAHILVDW
jgi:hypothetical protein